MMHQKNGKRGTKTCSNPHDGIFDSSSLSVSCVCVTLFILLFVLLGSTLATGYISLYMSMSVCLCLCEHGTNNKYLDSVCTWILPSNLPKHFVFLFCVQSLSTPHLSFPSLAVLPQILCIHLIELMLKWVANFQLIYTLLSCLSIFPYFDITFQDEGKNANKLWVVIDARLLMKKKMSGREQKRAREKARNNSNSGNNNDKGTFF